MLFKLSGITSAFVKQAFGTGEKVWSAATVKRKLRSLSEHRNLNSNILNTQTEETQSMLNGLNNNKLLYRGCHALNWLRKELSESKDFNSLD